MKNVNGEEINEELFLKKASERLREINEMLEDSDVTHSRQVRVIREITEYGMTMFHYGKFFENQRILEIIAQVQD